MNPQDPKTLMQNKPAPDVTREVAEASTMAELMAKPMKRYDLALEPQSEEPALRIAKMCAAMKLCGCTSPEDAYLRIIAGRALGLPAMASVQSIVPIWDKDGTKCTLTMYVKTKLALAISRPDVIEYVRPVEITDTKAVFAGKRVGQPEQTYQFTWEDAQRAELVGRGKDDQARKMNNYDRHPRAMLAWRACGRLLDLIAGDILTGIASHEDLADEADQQRAETRGQIPEGVKESIPVRDWAKEAEALKLECTTAFESKSNAALKAYRAKFGAFESEAPADVAEGVQRFYNVLAGQVSKSKAAPAQAAATSAAAPSPQGQPQTAAPSAAQAATPASPPPAQAPAAGAAPAARPQYLPPHQRGDSYEGPDKPEIPFG